MMNFVGSFKNLRGTVSSNTSYKMRLKILAKRGIEKIPHAWYGDSEKIPYFTKEQSEEQDPNLVFGLYIDKVSDLKIIDQFPNLVSLTFCNDTVQKVPTIIAKAKELRYLEIRCANLIELPKQLAELPNLKILEVGMCENLSDISALAAAKKITDLRIHDYNKGELVKDWTPLNKLPIEKLDLSNVSVGYLGNTIRELKNLKELQALISFQKGVDALKGIAKLERLKIESNSSYKEKNKVTNINEILEEQTELKALQFKIYDEYFIDYSGVKNLKKLEELLIEVV